MFWTKSMLLLTRIPFLFLDMRLILRKLRYSRRYKGIQKLLEQLLGYVSQEIKAGKSKEEILKTTAILMHQNGKAMES
jgi:hypothetical protein